MHVEIIRWEWWSRHSATAAAARCCRRCYAKISFFHRGDPLQFSNTSSIRAWMDPSAISIATADHNQQRHHYPAVVPIYPSSMSGIGFATGIGGFSRFLISARIQGDEEEHDGYSDKTSSASSDSRR